MTGKELKTYKSKRSKQLQGQVHQSNPNQPAQFSSSPSSSPSASSLKPSSTFASPTSDRDKVQEKPFALHEEENLNPKVTNDQEFQSSSVGRAWSSSTISTNNARTTAASTITSKKTPSRLLSISGSATGSKKRSAGTASSNGGGRTPSLNEFFKSSQTLKRLKPSDDDDIDGATEKSSTVRTSHVLESAESLSTAKHLLGSGTGTLVNAGSGPPKSNNSNQTVLDFGQKNVGVRICTGCGMRFSQTSPEDGALHAKFHQKYLNGVDYPGFAGETRIEPDSPDDIGAFIIILRGELSNPLKKKRAEIVSIVDGELGAPPTSEDHLNKRQVYCYVNSKKKIVGCIVAEDLPFAHRLIKTPSDKEPSKELG
ncbi:N-acetyltransferase esco2, partial [Blyttiomyces sp. JEL0837]